MCWNEHVSLNTFLFSSFMIGLIIYNNNYTPYKIPYSGIFVYLFLFSIVVMQLNEFFLWRNINNKVYNYIFSVVGIFILFLQPIFSLLMIKNNEILKINMILLYLFGGIPFVFYRLFISEKQANTTVSKCNHLLWNWNIIDNVLYKYIFVIIWLSFLFFSFLYNGWYVALLFGIVLYIYSMYYSSNDYTYTSIWCWTINSLFLIFAFYILLYLPYSESIKLK